MLDRFVRANKVVNRKKRERALPQDEHVRILQDENGVPAQLLGRLAVEHGLHIPEDGRVQLAALAALIALGHRQGLLLAHTHTRTYTRTHGE